MRARLNDVYADCVANKRCDEGLAVARASLEAWQGMDGLPDQGIPFVPATKLSYSLYCYGF